MGKIDKLVEKLMSGYSDSNFKFKVSQFLQQNKSLKLKFGDTLFYAATSILADLVLGIGILKPLCFIYSMCSSIPSSKRFNNFF